MSEKLNAGQFPVLQRPATLKHFVQHQQSLPQRVKLPSGDLAETGYLKITGEEKFNLYAVCQNDGRSKTLSIVSIAYIDEGDNLQTMPVSRMAPIALHDTAYVSKGKAEIVVGYITKVCGLRWGFTFKLNPVTGDCTIETDNESPIVGLKLQFN